MRFLCYALPQVTPLALFCHLCDARKGEDWNEGALAEVLHADPDNGTTIANIRALLINETFTVQDMEGLHVSDLMQSIDNGVPALVVYQAWTEQHPVNWTTDWVDGHYSLVCGYNDTHLMFMDPSTLGHYAAIPKGEFEQRWHDVDGVDTKVYQWALFASFPSEGMVSYDPYNIWYLG